MSCECSGSKRPRGEYDCKCGHAAELSRLAVTGQLVCRCRDPIDIAVRNGKGPVSSTDCARCGKQLRDQKRPWRYLVSEYATDPKVQAVWNAESAYRGRENWKDKTGDDFEETTAKYLTATHARAPEFMRWLDRNGHKLERDDLKHAAK